MILGYNSSLMENFIAIFKASFWFVLCVAVAVFLLAVALIYNGYMMIKKGFAFKKIEFPKLQTAR